LLWADGVELELTAMEFDLLAAFARKPNRVLTRERPLDLAHNPASGPCDRSIDVRIVRVRCKVERDPTKPQVIKTMRGAGYMFGFGQDLVSARPELRDIDAAQLRAVFDSIPTQIAPFDRDRRYCYINREYIEFCGKPGHEIQGHTIPEVLAEDAFAPFASARP
jgi:PAS domain-containing protein